MLLKMCLCGKLWMWIWFIGMWLDMLMVVVRVWIVDDFWWFWCNCGRVIVIYCVRFFMLWRFRLFCVIIYIMLLLLVDCDMWWIYFCDYYWVGYIGSYGFRMINLCVNVVRSWWCWMLGRGNWNFCIIDNLVIYW